MGIWRSIFGASGRERRAQQAVMQSLDAGQGLPQTVLNPLPRAERAEVLKAVLRPLMLDDRFDEAALVVAALAEVDPAAALEPAMTIAEASGQTDVAIDLARRQLDTHPTFVRHRGALAGLLVSAERWDEALAVLDADNLDDPTLGLIRADALIGLGRLEEARTLCAAIQKHAEGYRKQAMLTGDFEAWRDLERDAARRFDDLTAELEGAESVIRHAAARHDLDARAGVNYKLLAEAAMAAAEPPVRLTLQSPEQDLAEARARLTVQKDDPAAQSHLGCAELRLGHFDAAERAFRKALEGHPRWFPALLGLGAVLDEQRHGCRAAARSLTGTPCPSAWHVVVPDIPVLTAEEARVVFASVTPLASTLPSMAQAGARIRILPIDVRATDLPELADLAEERADDHRSLQALGGLATPRLAVARILDLIDTVSDGAWIFAHEFAHLAFWYLPSERQAEVEALYHHALAHPHTCGDYQLGNIDEFFAVGYENFLRDRHRPRQAPARDTEGVTEGLFRIYRAIEAGGGG